MTLEKISEDVRELINWVAVFEEEYDLPKEVVEQLRSKLKKIAKDITQV